MDYEKMKGRNAVDTAVLDKPYQLAVRAIPDEHWQAMMESLKIVPELATEESLTYYLSQMGQSLRNLNGELSQCRNQIREISSQAGRTQEQSLQRVKELEELLYCQAQRNQSGLLKKLAFWLGAGVMFLAALLTSLLIFLR